MSRDQAIVDRQRRRHAAEVRQQARDEKRRKDRIAKRARTAMLVDQRRARRARA